MNWLKTGCILSVVLLAASMTQAQTVGTSNVAQVAPVEISPDLVAETMSDSRTVDGGSLTLRAEYPIGEPGPGGLRVVTPGAVYSNVTTFTGYAIAVGGVTSASGTKVTKLLADDILCTLGGVPLVEFSFSVANFNTAAFSASPYVRFFTDNANKPGTYLGGYNFTAISFPAGSVGVYYATVTPAWSIPANGKMWIGTAYATTSGTLTQRNNFGVGLYNPVDVGSSVDEDFLSTANGGSSTTAFQANNPAGTTTPTPYPSAPARHGYEVVVATGACCTASQPLHCSVMTPTACTAAAGTYLGDNSMCSGLDCNGNGVDDYCDIASGFSQDCNGNRIPDECDIATGFSQDCQPDGIPDECQLGTIPILLSEGFTDITTLAGAGWNIQNLSSPVGSNNWFQGVTTNFSAQAGAATSYISANFNSTGSTGTISDWLLTPAMTLQNGVKLNFYTRTATGSTYADRMQVRMSVNGASTNVGATATSVGDFTTLMLDINPTYVSTGYPQTWDLGHYTLTVSGVATPTTGRFAFRYFVENGGASGANSNIIGIDTVKVTAAGNPSNDQNGNGIPDDCEAPRACCYSDGHCEFVVAVQCGGSWGDYGSTCTPNLCPPPPTGACCYPDYSCAITTELGCTGTFYGAGAPCSQCPPAPTGACCYADYTCAVTTAATCTGTWLGADVPCTQCPPPPPPTGACCYADYTCAVTTAAACTGTWLGADVPCTQCPPPPPPTGACCYADYTCAVTTAANCTGTWLGADVPCTQCPPPPPPTGACCYADYTCAVTTAADCTGTWLGADVPCTQCPPPPPPTGACCYADYTCAVTTAADCTGTWLGADVPCTQCPPPPPPTGACCYADYTCAVTTAADCTGTWLGADVPCTQCPPPPPPTGACCYADYTCAVTTAADCTGTWLGADVPCTQCPPPPPPTGACCYADYTCAVTTAADCTGTWLGADVPCTQCPPPPPPTGACCYADYTCAVTTAADCTGTWLGADVPCDQCPPPPPPTGACCYADYTCAVTTAADCTGTWLGADVPCTQCPPPPPTVCAGDLNCDGSIDFRDINPFVLHLSNFTAWQAAYPGCPPANGDINGDGTWSSFRDINPFVALLSMNPAPQCP